MKIEININDRLVFLFKKAFSGKRIVVTFLFTILLTSVIVYSAVSVPHVFTEGQMISASQINENFESLRLKMKELESIVKGAPVGTILPYGGDEDTIPHGWFLCDGSEKNRADYKALFAVLGIKWGAGNALDTFNLPDLRGRFIRGLDNRTVENGNLDPDAQNRKSYNGAIIGPVVGSYQDDSFQIHQHGIHAGDNGSGEAHYLGVVNHNAVPGRGSWNRIRYGAVDTPDPNDKNTRMSSETRPKNAAVNYIIKY